ncbi:MAG: hypothetical protein SCALA702_03190 [Melioribacteraceae bacterium]|nr:MAG: hypothetical protein SCALA702_03190 [Melioribacteraceae bacterium]
MVKLILKIVLLFCLAGSTLSAQKFVELYKDFIDPGVISTTQEAVYVNEKIEKLGKISPTLIYYYLLKINNNSRETDELKKIRFYYIRLFRAWEGIFTQGLSKWVEYESGKADENYSALIASEITGYLSDYEEYDDFYYIPPDTLHPNDTTHFFTYLYRSGEREEFSPGKDYKSLVGKIREEKVAQLKKYYADDNPVRREEEAINFAVANRYLFHDRASGLPYMVVPFHEFTQKFIEHKFRENSAILVGASGYGNPYIAGDEFAYNFVDYRFPYLNTKNTLKLEYTAQASVTAGYKHKLKKYKAPFSYVSGMVSFVISHSKNFDTEYPTNISVLYNEFPTRSFYGNYLLTIENDSYLAFGAEVETPLFYFNRNLFITGGLEINYYSIGFEANMERFIITLKSENPLDLEEGKLETKYEYSKMELFPFISLKIDFFQPVSVLIRSHNLSSVMLSAIFNWGI